MSKMIQIRDVPDQVHSTLKSRAAQEHMSLSDFLKKELASIAERPSMSEWLARARQTKPIASKRTAAQIMNYARIARCRMIVLDRATPGGSCDVPGDPAIRYPHTALLGRIWELRHNFTAYDAAYIALAEATDAPRVP